MNGLSQLLARFTFLRCLALMGLMLGSITPALAAKTYSDNLDGTVTDPTTGLIWMRCSMGQAWDGATCTGTANTYTFDQANALTGTVTFAGQSDWRVPNIRELQTIVIRHGASQLGLERLAFPNQAGSQYWTVSPFMYDMQYDWAVDLNGQAVNSRPGNSYSVRLVRGGQSGGLLNIARPTADYVDQENGTVTHSPSGLMWQRCAVGRIWTGSTCSGAERNLSAVDATFVDRSFAGNSDWRFPTLEELISLVDYQSQRAVNETIFPAPSAWFSGSTLDLVSGWHVYLENGYVLNHSLGGTSYAHLVRGGRPVDYFALEVSRAGSGSISSSLLGGIECGPTCIGSYIQNTQIILTASPSVNFLSWGGACADVRVSGAVASG